VISADPCVYRLVNISPGYLLAGFVGYRAGIPVEPLFRALVGKSSIDAQFAPPGPYKDQGTKVANPVCTGQTAILYCGRGLNGPVVCYCHSLHKATILDLKGPRWKRGETLPGNRTLDMPTGAGAFV